MDPNARIAELEKQLQALQAEFNQFKAVAQQNLVSRQEERQEKNVERRCLSCGVDKNNRVFRLIRTRSGDYYCESCLNKRSDRWVLIGD